MTPTTIPLTLGSTRGSLVVRLGAPAVVRLDDRGDIPLAAARLSLYHALLEGRCTVPAWVSEELGLGSDHPNVIKPGSLTAPSPLEST